MLENIKNKFQSKTSKVLGYGLLYFDHLHGEYCLLAPSITDEDDKKRLEEFHNKRKTELITWDDIYAYELILLKYQSFEILKSKVWSLRNRYRHVAGQSEYDEYLASKAVNLATISGETGEKDLRTDYIYLLREFCLLYSFMSAREELKNQLLKRGSLLTIGFFIFAVLVGILTPVLSTIVGRYEYIPNLGHGFTALCVVVFAGMTGAFVSMQQRIQNAPSKGDPLYNLSMLTHGWFSIFLSPLSGAIFALILYMFFVGGLLSGSIFPFIRTIPLAPCDNCISPNVGLVDFLKNTGPNSGLGYALLLIWSFIAGFAERFVPDKLNKLVTKDETEKIKQAED